ncbi:MAG: PHP domain-containing protein [Lachnospiraceae bacterium]|nr:PHP domain-containing protein [Lachnospiraceae bacterium]
MIKADFHMHSKVSDGSFSIAGLAKLAAGKGIDVIAVTDHDTLSHATQIVPGLPVRVLAGIEISCFDYEENVRVHILGYRIRDIGRVERFVKPLLEKRHENSLKQVKILKENGFSIEEEKLKRADGKYIYKQHIMEYLVNTGQVEDMFGEFYQKTFKNGGICDFDITYQNPYQAVEIIRESGGMAVLAHSGQQKNFRLIPELVKKGLSGLELNHPANSPDDRKQIRKYGEEYGLFLTGGSDFHGRYEKTEPQVGDFLSEESGVRAIFREWR